jgi:galactokinase
LEMDGVFGARMTGGGFGGCTVNMLRAGAAAEFSEQIARAYEAEFQVSPQIYECKPASGAGEVKDFGVLPPARRSGRA